jgi:hypothetical protein
MASAISKPAVKAPAKSKKKYQKPASIYSSTSTKAQNGSFKDGQAGEQSLQHAHNGKSQANVKPVDQFINDERDFRSYVVNEYDDHQEAAMKSHREALREVVRRVSLDGTLSLGLKDLSGVEWQGCE